MEWVFFLVLLGLLVCSIALLPVGIFACYNTDGPAVSLIAGPLRFRLYPRNKDGKSEEKKRKKPAEKFESHEKLKKGGKYSEFKPILQLVLKFLSKFRRMLRINDLRFKLVLAGGDPCDLSINYGRAWAAVGNLMPHLERMFKIKNRDIQVECDYMSEETLVSASINMTVSLANLLRIASKYGIKFLREYYRISKNIKDGATS